MNALDRLHLWLLKVIFPKKTWSTDVCANRVTWKTRIGTHAEATLIIRHLGLPDGYSREELVEMLRTVRLHEMLSGWRTPEPSGWTRETALDEIHRKGAR